MCLFNSLWQAFDGENRIGNEYWRLGMCIGRIRNLLKGDLTVVCLVKKRRRLVSLLECWFGSCWSLGDTRRSKDCPMVLSQSADALLLLSVGLPGHFTRGCFSFQAPSGFPNLQLLPGDIPRGLWVLLLCGQPGEGARRHRWVPPNASASPC